MIRRLSVLFATAMVMQASYGYELTTHALMSFKALQQSQIGTSATVRAQFGLSQYLDAPFIASSPFGSSYLDMGTTTVRRKARDYERSNFPVDSLLPFNPLTDALTFSGWIMRGAVREDDSPIIPFFSNDDPVNAIRPPNHFYDPVYNRGLQISNWPVTEYAKNPNWALGYQDAFASNLAPDDNRLNHFSMLDAREAFWRALTLTTAQGDPAPGDDLTRGPDIRKAYWATTFRALGDLVHLVQDLAQPQHTRNEAHSGLGGSFLQQKLGRGSVYEMYIDARARQEGTFSVNIDGRNITTAIVTPQRLTTSGYVIPMFSRYSEFFSTQPTGGGTRGIADYSNRNFFTQLKNVGNTEYANPSSATLSACGRQATDWAGQDLVDTEVTLFCADIRDDYTNTPDPGVPLAAESAWDHFVPTGGQKTFQLVKENYDAQADRLIPRAIGYSSGILNYFLRGTLGITAPPEGVYAFADHSASNSFAKVRANVTNLTPNETLASGKIVAVITYHRNSCYTSDLSREYGAPSGSVNGCRDGNEQDLVDHEELLLSQSIRIPDDVPPLASGQTATLSFDFSATPIPLGSSDLRLQIVFRGGMGSEPDAIAIGGIDISEPNYIALMNSTDYINIQQTLYTRDQVNNSPSLLSLIQPQSCVDYSVSPPHLKNGCFLPLPVDWILNRGAPDKPFASALNITLRHFARVVFLSDGPTVTLSQQTECLPQEDFTFDARVDQAILGNNPVTLNKSNIKPLRGVLSYIHYSCVLKGDDTDPTSIEVQNSTMTPFSGDELNPVSVTLGSF